MNIKKWYDSDETARICNISTKTIERRRIELTKNDKNKHWFKSGNNKTILYSYDFVLTQLSEDIRNLIHYSNQKSRTIKCLRKVGTLEQHLSLFDWDYFITISYEEVLNKKQCFTEMSKFYELLNNSDKSIKRMFFVTEPFYNRKGYHNHFILKTNLSPEKLEVLITAVLPTGIIDIQPYNDELAGFFYLTKEGAQGEDWDLLGNQLQAESDKLFFKPKFMDHTEKLKLKQQELGYESNPNKKSEIQNDISILKLRIEMDNIATKIAALQAKK